MNTITVAMLKKKKACPLQVKIVRKEWGGGEIPLNRDNLLRAVALGLDLSWFARHWFPPPLLAEYERQVAPLLAEYERQRAPLLAEYDRQRAPLLAEYRRQVAPLLAEYERQRALLIYALIAPQGKAAKEEEGGTV